MEPPTLFDITDAPTPDPPPAAWVTHHGLTGYRYGCRCAECRAAKKDRTTLDSQGLRRCQHCATTYPKTTGGGTKFCAACIRADVYWRNMPNKTIQPRRTCARCATEYRQKNHNKWNLCTPCARQPAFRTLSGRLAQHNAPTELVLAVIDWPYCANEQCGDWLLRRVEVRQPAHGIRYRSNFAVDHDHACCPDQTSCGSCIRGVVCRACNQMLLTDRPDIMRGLGHYLDQYAAR